MRKLILTSLATLISLVAAQTNVQAQGVYSPFAITPGSYNHRMVWPASETPGVQEAVNAFVGTSIALTDNTFYEQTLYQFLPGHPGYNSGAPHPGEVFTNVNDPTMTFQMPPSYAADDDLIIVNSTTYGTSTSGTLTFTTPTAATNLAVLCTGGNGGAGVTYIVTHSDSTTDTGSLTVPDWFHGGPTVAWGCNGRMDINGNFNNYNSSPTNNNPPYFYAVTVPVTNSATITSIEFDWATNGGVDNFFAISGEESGTWTPIPVTGFNFMTIIPASITPFPVDATMDNGTNVYSGGDAAGNTWFEKGFYRKDASAGLPASGTTLTSASTGTTYQLADYSTNCAILINPSVPLADITPVVVTNYASFSLLTSMGNGPGVNAFITQYADGTVESNNYTIYDWFQGAPPSPAWVANGRVTLNSRDLQNLESGNPKLFDSIVYLTNRTSPVTNIEIRHVSGGGSTCLLAIAAIGGNQLPPVFSVEPIPYVSLPGSNITFTASAFGFQPLTYQWYGPGTTGTGPNGSILIPGATNTTLTVSSVTGASSGQYYVVVTDGNGLTTVNTSPNGTQGGAFLNVITNALPGNYFSAIINLNPLGYWPLNESAPAPAWPAIAANSGSLGASANAVYSGQMAYGGGSALADGEGNSVTGDGTTTQVVLPYQSAVSTASVTMEGWFNPITGFNGGGETLMSDGEPNAANYTGFWINSGFNIAANKTGDINLLTYYGSAHHTGVSIDVTNIVPGNWYYVAVTVGPNPSSNSVLNGYLITLYTNGVMAGSGTADFVPNADAPLKIGNRSDDPGYGSYNFAGGMSEVAYYPAALSAARIAAHYAAASGPSPSYQTAVMSDSPTLYYQLNEAAPTFPAQDTGPVANNYGATGVNGNGVYLTGTMPGSVPGPGVEQFPGSDVAVAFNHIYWLPGGPTTAGTFDTAGDGNTGLTGYVDIPLDTYNSLDYTAGPVSLAAWVEATPNNGGRFSTILGKGDPSFRFDSDGTTTPEDQIHFNYGGNGAGDVNGNGSSGYLADGVWHFVVGTWDGTNQVLYVDGVANAANTSTDPITGDDYDFTIGEAPDDTGRAFDGAIAEVAIFTRALSSAEVQSLYVTAQVGAEIVQEPIATQTVGAGLTATMSATAIGDGTLSYQWYDNGLPASGENFVGINSNTLTINNSLTTDSGTYTLVVSNAYGSVTSTPSVLNILATPVVTTLFTTPYDTLLGSTISLQVNVQSASSYTNAWFYNGVLVTNGNGVSGANTTDLLILAGTPANNGTYQYFATNAFGVGSSSPVAVTVLPYAEPNFNTNGAGWTLNNNGISSGQGLFVTNDVIQLTDLNGSEVTAFFFDAPVYIGAFQASWVYTDVNSDGKQNDTADGFTFTLANNPKGPGALGTENGGAGGSGLGYTGISNSVALAVELYNNSDNAPGVAFATNGLGSTGAGNPTGYTYGHVAPVDIISGDPIQFNLVYDGQTFHLTLTDLVSNTVTFETNIFVGNLADDSVGTNVALVGFTGATGGVDAIQTIGNFTYIPLPLLTASVSGGNVVLNWPTGPGLGPFTLQSTTSLTLPWAPLSNPVSVVNGQYQVTIGPPSGNAFYRLVATP